MAAQRQANAADAHKTAIHSRAARSLTRSSSASVVGRHLFTFCHNWAKCGITEESHKNFRELFYMKRYFRDYAKSRVFISPMRLSTQAMELQTPDRCLFGKPHSEPSAQSIDALQKKITLKLVSSATPDCTC